MLDLKFWERKIIELETEIEKFKAENASLAKSRFLERESAWKNSGKGEMYSDPVLSLRLYLNYLKQFLLI